MKNIFLHSTFGRLSSIALVLAAFLPLAFTTVHSQLVSQLPVTPFNGNYQSIAGDGISCIFNQGQDDAVVQNGTGGQINSLALPFNFSYGNQLFPAGTAMSHCSNGFLMFGTNNNAATGNARYGVAWNINNCIMPFSCDLVLGGGAGYFEVQGTPPNRVAVYEWSKFYIFPSSASANGMQVRLYETTNIIEFWYATPGFAFSNQTLPASGDPSAAAVGLNGGSYSADNNYPYPAASALPPQNIRFGVSLPNIQLSAQPKSLNFGFQTSGQFTDRAFLITHSGTQGTLVISQLAVIGSPDYTVISPIPPPLNPGQFAVITVRFSPTASGLRIASVNVITNGRDSGIQAVALSGFGSSPSIVVDTTLPLFRGTRVRLGDSATRYIKILSNGQGSVIFNSFILSGIDKDQYFVSYMPVNPLPSGQTDSVGITYTPTREGKRTAILTINSNAGNAPSINISLLGTGILPRILITPSVLFFDSTAEGDTSCKQISIQNVGSDTLRLKANFFSSGEGDFTYATLTGKDTIIAPDQTKLINVCFHPLQQGTREARLLFKTNIPLTFETPRRDTSIVTMELRGNGVPLGILANTISGLPILDSEIVGKTICRVDTLRNNGDADITVTSVLFSNPVFAMGARQLPPVPFVLKSRSFMVFDLCGTPALQGINAGTFSVSGTSNTRSIALAPIPLGVFGLNVCVNTPATLFGQVVLPNTGKADSTLCFFVVNCGDIPDTYTAALSGQNKGDYTIISQLPAGPIAPTDTQTICLKYKPSANGPSPASLDITPANAAKTSIVLGGSAGCAVLAAPVVDNIPNTGTFSAQPFKITINNTGTFTWDPGKVIVTGDASFVVDSVTVTGNPPTQVITVYMHFLPTKIGTETAQVSFPNGGPCDSLGAVSLTATSVKGSVAPTTQEGFSLEQTYPNPTQGKVAFTYTTPRECEVKIELVDMTGRVLENLVNGKVSGGEYTVSFDASKYPSGTYLYMLESGSVRLVRQLILAK